jgi:hypothetical protein
MIPPLFGKQEVGIWRVQKRFPRYGVPIWSLWPNIRFLQSTVTEKNATKNGHIQNECSMCIKINKVDKQEVGIWRVQKRYPQYGIPIWRLWPNIRFLPSTVTEKNATKNILDRRKDGRTEGRTDGQTDRGKTVYPSPPSGSGGIHSRSIIPIRRRANMYSSRNSMTFHPWCSINRISKQTIPRHLHSYYPSYHWTTVESYTNLQKTTGCHYMIEVMCTAQLKLSGALHSF